MITNGHGDLLQADVDALVNTVNTVGVMGKGLALQFRRAYPDMHDAYLQAANAGGLELGRMHVWSTKTLTGPRFIINFPTKRHWRARSHIESISTGLIDLVRVIEENSIRSIAIPPLGCGNGGLEWTEVEPLIRDAMEPLNGVEVLLYGPGATPSAASMRNSTEPPGMTAGRAALICMIRRYLDHALEVSLIEVQKLLYFMQLAGEPLRLNYAKGRYGPYADNLRHVLRVIEGHYVVGYGDGTAPVQEAEPLRLLDGAHEEASRVLRAHPETSQRIDRVLRLAQGFESAYGLELLASVHWVAAHEPDARVDPSAAAAQVRNWTSRKAQMFTLRHVATAWSALDEQGWLQAL